MPEPFSVAALVGFSKQVVNLGDQLSDLADQTGISIRVLGGIKPILDSSNSSIDGFAKGFNKLQKSLGDLGGEGKRAAEALRAIKLDPLQIANASPDQALEQIVAALGKVENANERAAMRVLGAGLHSFGFTVFTTTAAARRSALDRRSRQRPGSDHAAPGIKQFEYMRHLKASSKDTAVYRKIYAFHGFFKFLRKNKVTLLKPFEDVEFKRVYRALPKVLTVQE